MGNGVQDSCKQDIVRNDLVKLYAFIKGRKFSHDCRAKITHGFPAHWQYNDSAIEIEHSAAATGNLNPFVGTLASKFKKRNPEFSELFVASETELSKNPRLAHTVGGRAKHKLKPATVEIDPDFYGERNIKARADALFAKFSQNMDLCDMLKLTYPAKLVLRKRGQKPEENTALMQVRQQLTK